VHYLFLDSVEFDGFKPIFFWGFGEGQEKRAELLDEDGQVL
jgi:hypothetical protein